MARAMIAAASRKPRGVSVAVCAVTVLALAGLVPNPVEGAGMASRSSTTPTFPVPASARVGAPSTSTSKVAPATTTPATGVHPGTTTTPPTTPATVVPPTATSPGTTTTPGTTTHAPTTPGTTVPPTATSPGSTTPAATTPATAAPAGTPATTGVGVARGAHRGGGLSTGALALAVFGALLALGCAGWALSRWLVIEPRWTVSLMHSLDEAGFRATATWAEFTDWVRLGR